VYGEWGGKSSSDYIGENVKVVFGSEEKHTEVSKQLDICRRILGKTP